MRSPDRCAPPTPTASRAHRPTASSATTSALCRRPVSTSGSTTSSSEVITSCSGSPGSTISRARSSRRTAVAGARRCHARRRRVQQPRHRLAVAVLGAHDVRGGPSSEPPAAPRKPDAGLRRAQTHAHRRRHVVVERVTDQDMAERESLDHVGEIRRSRPHPPSAQAEPSHPAAPDQRQLRHRERRPKDRSRPQHVQRLLRQPGQPTQDDQTQRRCPCTMADLRLLLAISRTPSSSSERTNSITNNGFPPAPATCSHRTGPTGTPATWVARSTWSCRPNGLSTPTRSAPRANRSTTTRSPSTCESPGAQRARDTTSQIRPTLLCAVTAAPAGSADRPSEDRPPPVPPNLVEAKTSSCSSTASTISHPPLGSSCRQPASTVRPAPAPGRGRRSARRPTQSAASSPRPERHPQRPHRAAHPAPAHRGQGLPRSTRNPSAAAPLSASSSRRDLPILASPSITPAGPRPLDASSEPQCPTVSSSLCSTTGNELMLRSALPSPCTDIVGTPLQQQGAVHRVARCARRAAGDCLTNGGSRVVGEQVSAAGKRSANVMDKARGPASSWPAEIRSCGALPGGGVQRCSRGRYIYRGLLGREVTQLSPARR